MDFKAVQSYLRETLRRWRESERVGPFLASFSRSSRNPFLNYAIPDDAARPSEEDVAKLVDAYRQRNLKPRLEYIPNLCPLVEPVLVAAGFEPEGRPALMSFPPARAASLQLPPGIELVAPTSDEELLGVRRVQHAAYNEPEPAGSQEVESLRRSVTSGGGAVLARTAHERLPVGAGEFTSIIEGVTEIAGIGVIEAYRRRGIASAMTGWLVRAAAEAGATDPFLMAMEAEERIYAGVGFVTEGSILHISLQASSGG